MRKALLMLVIMLPAMFSGCFGEDEIISTPVEESAYLQPWERADMTYVDTDIFSRVTENGSYETDTVRSVFVDVPTITAADGGAGLTGDAVVHLGLWLPVIEGCDWEATDLSEDCQVPVIAEIGPYYNDGDVDVLSASSTDDKVAWYENLDGSGGSFSTHVITTSADNAMSVSYTHLTLPTKRIV